VAAAATAGMIVLFPLPFLAFFSSSFLADLAFEERGLFAISLLAVSILSVILFWLAYNSYRLNKSALFALSESGIEFPDSWNTRTALPWSRVEKIAVSKKRSTESPDETLVLTVKGHSPIKLKLLCLSPEDLDKFVSACQLWSNRWTQDASFSELVERVTNKRLESSDSSFTALWMQEANRRVGTTPFVPLKPGTILQDGRVKVIQPLTTGGWSAIYLCQWQENTPSILKEAVVPPGVNDGVKKKAYEHFERESVLLSGLNHPQIAKVLDYFLENGRQYMVLRKVSGANLRAYIKDRGPVSEKQALRWTNEIVNILVYLHHQKPPIIHRDLTPENLVIDMRGSLVLIDFGSANEFVGTVTGTLVGKPSYISPEHFSGHANLQSDLYSLGAVIYFMLSGKDPEPLTTADLKSEHPQIRDDVATLVSDLMQLDLKRRARSIEEVQNRLSFVTAT
jgi:tRNA A-37 threonylcarbamoyl transferase component Bud32